MEKRSDKYGKFVRVNVIGEFVEVVGFDSTEITIKFKGQNLTLKRYEVSRIVPEDVVRKMSLSHGRP